MAESFSAQMKSFANMTEDKALKVFKRTCLDIASSVIKDTAVDSGRARGSWMPEINMFSTSDGSIDKDGSKTIANVGATTKQLSLGATFTLASNIPYIERLEYLSWSKQSPNGMVRINLLRFQSILNIANKEIK